MPFFLNITHYFFAKAMINVEVTISYHSQNATFQFKLLKVALQPPESYQIVPYMVTGM